MADIWTKQPWAKNHNFRNPKNYVPLDPEFYADYYS